jgi:hypothetical protein
VPKTKVVPCLSNYPYTQFGEFCTWGRSLFSISKFRRWKILKKIRKATGSTCQWPTASKGCVSRPVRAHACTVTPRWLGHHLPPHAGVVDCPPPSLHTQPMQPPPPRGCCALILRSGHVETCSPPLPLQPPSSRPTLLCLSPRSSALSVER